MCTTKTEIVSFRPPVTCGYVGGGMGSMTRSSIHWRQEPASQSTKCSEAISLERIMAPSGKNGQTFGLDLKRRLAWSAFYYLMRGKHVFSGHMLLPVLDVWGHISLLMGYTQWDREAEKPQEKRRRGVSRKFL